MTEQQQAIHDGLPEHLRPIYARTKSAWRLTANKALVTCGALFAVDELQAGRANPQNGGVSHTEWGFRIISDRLTALDYPPLPDWLSEQRKAEQVAAVKQYYANNPNRGYDVDRTSNRGGHGGFGD